MFRNCVKVSNERELWVIGHTGTVTRRLLPTFEAFSLDGSRVTGASTSHYVSSSHSPLLSPMCPNVVPVQSPDLNKFLFLFSDCWEPTARNFVVLCGKMVRTDKAAGERTAELVFMYLDLAVSRSLCGHIFSVPRHMGRKYPHSAYQLCVYCTCHPTTPTVRRVRLWTCSVRPPLCDGRAAPPQTLPSSSLLVRQGVQRAWGGMRSGHAACIGAIPLPWAGVANQDHRTQVARPARAVRQAVKQGAGRQRGFAGRCGYERRAGGEPGAADGELGAAAGGRPGRVGRGWSDGQQAGSVGRPSAAVTDGKWDSPQLRAAVLAYKRSKGAAWGQQVAWRARAVWQAVKQLAGRQPGLAWRCGYERASGRGARSSGQEAAGSGRQWIGRGGPMQQAGSVGRPSAAATDSKWDRARNCAAVVVCTLHIPYFFRDF
ncbi:hypothetical protein B0H14DRAFT_3172229 [Mycena olivaceomarginata]|nr:hypothetical protein B0H14DRAFT_3172229 [Mycena olivaceomarginata]